MDDESIDDIFKDFEAIDGEISKINISSFKFDKKDAKSISSKNEKESSKSKRIDHEYFFNNAQKIKRDEFFIPLRGLLVANVYDRIDFDEEILKEKYELKLNALSKYGHYKFSPKRTEREFEEMISSYDDLKYEKLFSNDYFPYMGLVKIYERKYDEINGIKTILEFFKSKIYCNKTVFENFKYHLNIFLKRANKAWDSEILNIVENYERNRENYNFRMLAPIADRIYENRGVYYLISEEKYEFNQALLLLMAKAMTVQSYLGYEYAVKFCVNLMDSEILYFKYFAHAKLGFISKRMNNSDKFLRYYLDALKDKHDFGNILTEDFDRIFSCKQIEIDYLNTDEISNKVKFDELFGDEYKR